MMFTEMCQLKNPSWIKFCGHIFYTKIGDSGLNSKAKRCREILTSMDALRKFSTQRFLYILYCVFNYS